MLKSQTKNRIFISLIFLLSFIFIKAQSNNVEIQNDIQVLYHKIDSLEHEVSYLKIYNELQKLAMDIKIEHLDISADKTDINYFISNKYYKKEYAYVIQDQYYTYKTSIQRYKDRAEDLKTLYIVNSISYSYTEDEIDYLSNLNKYLNLLIPTLESELNSYKIVMNHYLEKCKLPEV